MVCDAQLAIEFQRMTQYVEVVLHRNNRIILGVGDMAAGLLFQTILTLYPVDNRRSLDGHERFLM